MASGPNFNFRSLVNDFQSFFSGKRNFIIAEAERDFRTNLPFFHMNQSFFFELRLEKWGLRNTSGEGEIVEPSFSPPLFAMWRHIFHFLRRHHRFLRIPFIACENWNILDPTTTQTTGPGIGSIYTFALCCYKGDCWACCTRCSSEMFLCGHAGVDLIWPNFRMTTKGTKKPKNFNRHDSAEEPLVFSTSRCTVTYFVDA